ncbi:hypothetical protein CROQUDRAFT_563054 [Cronartium quercuum f. sp. fusiforme G11]|uniref:Uncharacterized protein n=1 Tax=Cronartium quercuum f. sp. fusiforme G11 TaxID=708437 RepID=A0A9P6TCD7_9BASI|nr:hypothetical protein CROQUDRAFT_563054 [Cronartium quercuum f. sp. fusiforme G11]
MEFYTADHQSKSVQMETARDLGAVDGAYEAGVEDGGKKNENASRWVIYHANLIRLMRTYGSYGAGEAAGVAGAKVSADEKETLKVEFETEIEHEDERRQDCACEILTCFVNGFDWNLEDDLSVLPRVHARSYPIQRRKGSVDVTYKRSLDG